MYYTVPPATIPGSNRHTTSIRRCWLGRMHNNKKIDNRICNQISRINNPLWIKNTSNCCTIKCGIRIILNRNRSTRSTTHQELSDGNNIGKQTTNLNPHGLNKRKEYCNKNRIIKGSKTHWSEVPIHTTIGAQRHTISAQDLGQHRLPTNTSTTLGFWAQTTIDILVATVSQGSKHKQFHIHINKRDAGTMHTSVVDAMVSQSYMDTISTISFWTLTIRPFTGWRWQLMSQFSFAAWDVNNVKFQQWLKVTILNETTFAAWISQSVWRQFFRQSFFFYKKNNGWAWGPRLQGFEDNSFRINCFVVPGQWPSLQHGRCGDKGFVPRQCEQLEGCCGDDNYWFVGLHNEGVQEDDWGQWSPKTIERWPQEGREQTVLLPTSLLVGIPQ